MKKGAMFGLDARIALAIFGALSVISGAALYSAIENARLTKEWTQYREYAKAYQSYYLDTADMIGLPGNSNGCKLFNNSSNISGWRGPYLQQELAISGSGTKHMFTGCAFSSQLVLRSDIINKFEFGFSTSANNIGLGLSTKYISGNSITYVGNDTQLKTCKQSGTCAIYYQFTMVSNYYAKGGPAVTAILNDIIKLDNKFDGGSGSKAGNIIWHDYGSTTGPLDIFIKMMPVV